MVKELAMEDIALKNRCKGKENLLINRYADVLIIERIYNQQISTLSHQQIISY
jgi:hypothetical protein